MFGASSWDRTMLRQVNSLLHSPEMLMKHCLAGSSGLDPQTLSGSLCLANKSSLLTRLLPVVWQVAQVSIPQEFPPVCRFSRPGAAPAAYYLFVWQPLLDSHQHRNASEARIVLWNKGHQMAGRIGIAPISAEGQDLPSSLDNSHPSIWLARSATIRHTSV